MNKIARVYLRVSTNQQDLDRQEGVVHSARQAGYYVAAVYREKASGVLLQRPELQRLINDLQEGEVVIAEKMDRISRLPLDEAIKLVNAIKSKGAKLAVPGVIDLSEIANSVDGVSKIVVDAVQDLLLKLALQIAHDDYNERRKRTQQGIQRAKEKNKYKGRKPNLTKNNQIIEFRNSGKSIAQTASLVKCSPSQVKLIWKKYIENEKENLTSQAEDKL